MSLSCSVAPHFLSVVGSRPVQHMVVLPQIPDQPPSSATALAIFHEFHASVEHLEQSLRSQRIKQARERRKDQPMLVFKDIGKEPPQKVETLHEITRAIVVDVCADDVSVTLDPPGVFTSDEVCVFATAFAIQSIWRWMLQGCMM